MALPNWTDQQVFEQMNSGSLWHSPIITYAFPQLASQINYEDGEAAGFLPINAAQQPLIELSMTLWDDLIGPRIQQGTLASAQIMFGNSSAMGNAYAYAYMPPDSSVWFSTAHENLLQPKIGEDSFITFVHEIGHALGLDHMGDYNGEDNDGPSSYQDSDVYSIMSYYGPGIGNDGGGEVAWADWQGHSAQTPMLNDIMVIQQLYGTNVDTRTDDTVYGFGSNIQGPTAQIYDFSINANPILTIYDAGGIDTLDLSGWGTDSRVDLNPGQYSDANGMTSNIAIAWSAVIENAVTGAGDDILIGNFADNYLDGGAGQDTAVFIGDFSNYNLSYNLFSREYTVQDLAGFSGIDTLINIEFAAFGDYRGDLNDLTPAVHRFYNPDLGAHFYTSNNDEGTLVAQMGGFQYEGTGFGRIVNDESAVSVARFFNSETNDHFYTANQAEADTLRELGGAWQDEGFAFDAYTTQVEGTTELFRFVNKESGTHFYTNSVAEMDAVMLSGYFDYEGVAFYVMA